VDQTTDSLLSKKKGAADITWLGGRLVCSPVAVIFPGGFESGSIPDKVKGYFFTGFEILLMNCLSLKLFSLYCCYYILSTILIIMVHY